MNVTIKKKRCCRCKKLLSFSNFHRDSTRRDGHVGRCKLCTTIYARETGRHKYKVKRNYLQTYYQKYPAKKKAHSAIQNALRRVKIKRYPCIICGDTKSEAHHNDYEKPLDVVWLCRKHHQEHHNLSK